MYDDSYLPVITLGGTTLINQLWDMPNWNEVIVEIQQKQQRNPNVNPLNTLLEENI